MLGRKECWSRKDRVEPLCTKKEEEFTLWGLRGELRERETCLDGCNWEKENSTDLLVQSA